MKKRTNIVVNFGGKKKSICVEKLSLFGMIRGLMFRSKKFDKILLFNFSKETGYSIHSFFVFFNFLAVWLDDKNNVCEVMNVAPFRFIVRPKRPYYRLLEIPLNNHNNELIRFFVGKRKI